MNKSKIMQILKLAVIFLSFWFIGEKFWVNYSWLQTSVLNFNLLITIIVCSIIYGFSEFFLSFAWRKLLMWCGHKKISVSLCNSIYGKSQIAKYVPGNIFHVLGRHVLGNQAGVNHIILAGATVYEILGLVSISSLIGLSGMIIFGLGNLYFSLNQIILTLIITLLLTISAIVFAPHLMSLRGIILPNRGIWESIRNIGAIYIFYFIFFLIAGLLLVLIVRLFFNLDYFTLTKVITIFSIAWVAGFIIPGAPGGIGVREAVLIYFITPIIGEAESVAVAIALRLVTLFGDTLFFTLSDISILNFKQKN